ncbi:MAG TPA: SagB/ThcOx family dehydrogenase [Terriglobales bacterium]|jgi:SagB-type dehydrogenase family enzyme|nr:SagB/ThcOx family dehydrogenase [Terriglobales bacterium]
MSDNRNPEVALKYHNATKHSYISVRSNQHFLDFNNQPIPFKIYPTLPPVPLPSEVRQTGVAALSAISETVIPETSSAPDLEAIAQLLYLSAGITRHRKYPGGEIYFRAAACTGALYEVELYLVCGDLANLAAGVYHFAAAEFGLRKLRGGDYRGVLMEATAAEHAVVHAPLTVICTCTYWRNAWKYQDRTYRHFGWDNGTLLANMLAVATAQGLPANVVCGFVDDAVNRLLDVDPHREISFALVPLGYTDSLPAPSPAELSPLGLETVPLSHHEVDYPLMRELHAASSLSSPAEVASWRGGTPLTSFPPPSGPVTRLQPLSDAEMPRDPIEQVILRRGSSRRFAPTPITLAQLSTMLDRATRGIPADFLDPLGSQLNHLYLIVNAVQGLDPGAYVFHRGRKALELLKPGEFRSQAGYLGLQQALPADAAVDVFFLADLEPILQRFGNRGYRAVQLEAGILGGKLYLAAYAQHLGATGLTFFDDDVTNFFSPHAKGKSAIFLVALGHSAKTKS